MADNKLLPATGTGTANVTTRTKDRSGVDTPIVALDLNPSGTEALMDGAMPTRGITSSPATATWDNTTAANTTLALAVAGYRSIALMLVCASSVSDGIGVFEASLDGGTTWASVSVIRHGGTSVQALVTSEDFSPNGSFLYTLGVGGFTNFRVRLTDQITGAGTVALTLIAGSGGESLVAASIAALPPGNNNIGDVDVATVPADPFGLNADAASATGSISAKLRFIASTGVPVTNAGTFAVQAASTNNAASQADGHSANIGALADADTALTLTGLLKKIKSLLPGALGGNGGLTVEGIVGGTAVPVSLATVPSHAVTNAGTFATQAASTNAAASQADGHSANIGALADADTALTLTGLLKKIKALFNGGLPAALGAQGGLKIEGVASGTAVPVSLASAPSTAVTNAGTFATQVDGSALTALQLIDDSVFADEASFTTASSKVNVAGVKAVTSGSAPDDAGGTDRAVSPIANRNRVQFVIGGDPGVITLKHTTITTAVTDAAIITIATSLKIVVTRISVTLDNASTVFPTLLLGFGTTNTPTTTGVLVAHGGVPAGGGITVGDGSGILGIGADGEDLRVTTTGNATGNGLQICVTYYLVVA